METAITKLDPAERSREYVFPGGERLKYQDVVALGVSSRGTHRLELKDGRKIIVPMGWLAIELDVDKWTL
jgi:hypothetical protein